MFLLVLAAIPAQVAAQCVNDDSFLYFFEDKIRSCRNIRINEGRRQTLCPVAEVNAACPQTCGQCCENVAGYEFTRFNGLTADCDWLGEKQVRIDKYCENTKRCFSPSTGFSPGSTCRTIRDGCPVTCDFCQDPIAVPTVSPAPTATASPTESPTEAAPSCVNDASFTFELVETGNVVGCGWITKNKGEGRVEIRRKNYCGDSAIATACPQACGTCTADDPLFTTQWLGPPCCPAGCDWITKNKDKTPIRLERCRLGNVAAGCAETCA